MNDAANDFVCPRCFDRSCVSTTCIRCGNIDMLPRSATPSDGSVPTIERARRLPRRWSMWRAVLLTASLLSVIAPSAIRVATRAHWNYRLELSIASLVVMAVMYADRFLDLYAHIDILDLRRYVASLYPKVARTRIADANDGLVRIVGIGELLVKHLTPEGAPSLAYRSNLLTARDRAVIPLTFNVDAGCFVISDGSGMNALVNSRWVEIAGRTARNGSVNVPPGSTIEVTGYASRVPVPEAMNGGLRRAPEILEFTGTPERPVVIRLIDAKGASEDAVSKESSVAITGVRIATEAVAEQTMESTVDRTRSPGTHRSVRV